MTEEIMNTLAQDLKRLEAAQACRNLMGKYSYYHTAFRNYEYIDLWAKRDDCILKLPWGKYDGFEGVKACYLKDHGDRSDPACYERLKGGMFMHEMDTEVLEVAADCKTARGVWITPGHETFLVGDNPDKPGEPGKSAKPRAEWCWGKYAVDFIVDNGEWKIWRMRLYPLFKSDYYVSWADYKQPDPEDFGMGSAQLNETGFWSYGPGKVYPANEPEPPLPYEKYEDVGYCL